MRKVVVVGLGKSGIEAAKLLAGRGDNVFITEVKGDAGVRSAADGLVKDNVVQNRILNSAATLKSLLSQLI